MKCKYFAISLQEIIIFILYKQIPPIQSSGADPFKTKYKGPMHQYYSENFKDQISFVFFR